MPPKGPKAPAKPAGKKGPPAAMLAKLKMKMQMQKAEEERRRKEAEEQERRIREQERLAEQQRKFEEEQRARERERKKEEERKARKALRSQDKNDALERMRASGFIVPDIDKIREQDEAAKEKAKMQPAKPRMKKGPPKSSAAATNNDTNVVRAQSERVKQGEGVSDEDDEDDGEHTQPTDSDVQLDEDDWEQIAQRDDRRAQRHARNEQIRARRAERKALKAKAKEEEKAAKMAAAASMVNGHEHGNFSNGNGVRGQGAGKYPNGNSHNLRSPICCVLGHVDAGKTSLLDYMRSTNVQGGEAGGITQQIGATFFPREAIIAETAALNEKYHYDLHVPGLLVIDTPGHESFTNLRSRGSSLCDLAVLVVDLMHGLQQQTRQSIRLLRDRKCPFIVALNKVDRLYGWQEHKKMDFEQTLSLQKPNVRAEFESHLKEVKLQMSIEGLNTQLYYRNDNPRKVVSIVPTSAKTGEGVCDLLLLQVRLVQQFMESKVTYTDSLECTVLEVKPIEGHGLTIDVILSNGELHEGDEICVCGQNGPIFTTIRALLTPQPMKELRVRGGYVHHKMIKAAMAVKLVGNGLDSVVPGTSLMVVGPHDDKEAIARSVMQDASNIASNFSADGVGVTVLSSTLGALEALLSFLKDMKIPIGDAGIGPLRKKNMNLSILMKRRDPRYAVVLCFDVNISDEAREIAEYHDIKIFEAKIIYHLFDLFTQYLKDYEKSEKDRLRSVAVFPVQLKIIGEAFNHTDPIIMPVKVIRGQLRVGSPLCFINEAKDIKLIGKVISMENNHKPVEKASEGMEVSVKINSGEYAITFGRQIDIGTIVYSHITRQSVDAVKKFKDELTPDDVILLATLIKMFNVPK